eukprot:2580287-Pyramimonas_sp.AAC.1
MALAALAARLEQKDPTGEGISSNRTPPKRVSFWWTLQQATCGPTTLTSPVRGCFPLAEALQ